MTANPSRAGAGRRASRVWPRALLATLLLLAALAAGHSLLWRWLGDRMEEGFAAWAESRRAQGWSVEHGPTRRGGWPFAATLTVPGLRLAGGAATVPGGMEWRSGTLVLRVAPPRLDRLKIEMQGPQRLRLGTLEIPYAADRLEASLPLERGVLPHEGRFEAERLRLGTPGGATELREAQLAFDTRSTAIEGEPALALTLHATGVELPPTLAQQPAVAGLGRRIESAGLEAVLTGPVPGGRNPTARAEAWRDGGGTLELRGAELLWGPVTAGAAATLTLDDALQPMGAGTLRVSGLGEALEALTTAGAIGPRAALTARTILGLMARAPENGGPPRVEVPMTLEDRTLTVARIPIARFGVLAWPPAPH